MKVSSIIPKFRIRKFRNDIPSIDLSPFFFQKFAQKKSSKKKVYHEDEEEEEDDGTENHPESKPASKVSSEITKLRNSKVKTPQ